MSPRILTMAHGHPDFRIGGGELAAYQLFHAYKASKQVLDAWFLAHAAHGNEVSGSIRVRRAGEYLWDQRHIDFMMMKAVHQAPLESPFGELVRDLRPTIVHAHHYIHLGLDYLAMLKRIDPRIAIFLTLHEYMAICRNDGQMIKTKTQQLCQRESAQECQRCFPDHSVEDFWLRKHLFQGFFRFVDGFIAPSEFLRQRYIDWGLPADRIVVIENGQAEAAPMAPRPLIGAQGRHHFGFFGQVTPYKGLDLILEALLAMPVEQRKQIVVELHCVNFETQASAFVEKLERLLAPLKEEGVVRWMGPYSREQLGARMAGVDWVLVPSIWWENSPMVIQEAFTFGRPVICSDIGGMREKVRPGVDGLHVAVGSASAWGETLTKVVSDAALWDSLRAGIVKPLSVDACAQRHLQVFEALRRSPR
jgi:glycosyltransferase involved in cell wall biosynthesis